jgi:hypothetical protein
MADQSALRKFFLLSCVVTAWPPWCALFPNITAPQMFEELFALSRSSARHGSRALLELSATIHEDDVGRTMAEESD